MSGRPSCTVDALHAGRDDEGASMPDLLWLAVLGGLFLLTLAFVRLCDAA